MIGNLISASNKEEAGAPAFVPRWGAEVSNEAWPLPRITAIRPHWASKYRPKLPSVQTGCSNGRCRSLEGGQERVDVDVGQFLGLVGLVRRADGAVRVGGIQIKDQILHVRWRPRCRCLPQAAVSQKLFDDLAPTIAPLWCPRFDERHDLHRGAALRTRQWVYFINPLDQHRPCLATARRCHRRSAVLTLV